MSVVRQVARAVGAEPRPPCSDAERYAAERIAAWLRARGDAAEVRTRRTRPQALAAVGIGAALAAAGSLVAVAAPVAGLAGAAAGTLVLALEAAGVTNPVRLLFPRRTTHDVIVPVAGEARETSGHDALGRAAGDGRERLIVCARYHSPRRGLAFGDRARRAGARLRRPWLPGAGAWLVLAGMAAAAAAGTRVAGAGAVWLGAAQLVPTLALLVAAAAILDAGLAGWATPERATAAVAVAVAVHDELASRPPRNLAPALILMGAGDSPAGAAILLELAPLGAGPVGWRATDPRLHEAGRRAAAALGRGGGPLLPRPPRGVVRVGGGDTGEAGEVDMSAAVDLTLGIVDALDSAVTVSGLPSQVDDALG